MSSKFIEKIKGSFSSDQRPQIPLAQPEAHAQARRESEAGSYPRDARKGSEASLHVHFKGEPSPKPTSSSHNVVDAAHSPPSVLSQHLGPPTIEHKYPKDSKWRRHSVSAQEQHYMR